MDRAWAAVVVAVTLAAGQAASAQGPRPAAPRGGPGGDACFPSVSPAAPTRSGPRLLPVDDAVSRPDFFSFRAQLLAAIARRDEAALLASVDPGIRTSFGDDTGVEAFARQLRDPQSAVWGELGAVLALGGRFRSATSFEAPYVFAAWPERLDSFECAAVTGERVRVRATPDPLSAVVGTVSYDIVRLAGSTAAGAGLRHVVLANGVSGYMAARYVRSPVEKRAIFQATGGQWRLAAFVSGD